MRAATPGRTRTGTSCCWTTRTGGAGTRGGSPRGGTSSSARCGCAASGPISCRRRSRRSTMRPRPHARPTGCRSWACTRCWRGSSPRLWSSSIGPWPSRWSPGRRRASRWSTRSHRSGTLDGYLHLHSARADLLRRLDRRDESMAAYARALELATNEPERVFLQGRLKELRTAANVEAARRPSERRPD